MARDYELQRPEPTKPGYSEKPPRVVASLPKPGERMLRAYTKDQLDSLFATARSLPLQSFLSLKVPPAERITDWPSLRQFLRRTKRFLENLHRRKGFPACLFVTEFDPLDSEHRNDVHAAFHIAFTAALTLEQQHILAAWWLRKWHLENNRGRQFDYKEEGGGQKLQNYMAKDIDFRDEKQQWCKFPAPWLPARLECRLWFSVGCGRNKPAAEGRKLRAREGRIRKRFEGKRGRDGREGVRARKAAGEGGQGSPLITAETLPVGQNQSVAVVGGQSSAVGRGQDALSWATIAQLRTASPVACDGGTMRDVYSLVRASKSRLLSLRLDRGALCWAQRLHHGGQLRLVCAPPSSEILHMLVVKDAALPDLLRMQFQPGTSVPRTFEVVYLAA